MAKKKKRVVRSLMDSETREAIAEWMRRSGEIHYASAKQLLGDAILHLREHDYAAAERLAGTALVCLGEARGFLNAAHDAEYEVE